MLATLDLIFTFVSSALCLRTLACIDSSMGSLAVVFL